MFTKYLNKQTDGAPLVVFRMLFGLMMFLSIVRFWWNGWIEKLYIDPIFSFSYYGFEWVKPLGSYTYILFLVCAIAAIGITVGFKYRWSVLLFFLSFTYIELMDKTTYLNHYYFVSLLSFLLLFLPANIQFSIDAYLKNKSYKQVPSWTIDSIKLLLSIVYFYAGLAKLNSDWLFRAMPLKIWLPSKYDLPLIGQNLMQQDWFHYTMSWGGAIYDLTIPFLLLYKRTRLFAFVLVLFFHIFTRVLFPIGMFPYIMIVSSLIFFDAKLHRKILSKIKQLFKLKTIQNTFEIFDYSFAYRKMIQGIVAVFFVIQFVLPWRYLLYPGELFWTEEGFRFSWRVMLIEKMGNASFKIVDGKSKESFYVDNSNFLTYFQEKQMSFQPDFILEYAHYLGNHFTKMGMQNVEVYVDCFVALNGRMSTQFVNPKVNLMNEKESFKHKNWIIPFNDSIKIKGL
ncbi:HTTM domain-containing protein [Urechidicola sp. KH5]